MKQTRITFKQAWRVIPGTKQSQAAVMVIPPGDREGGVGNKHDGDQWLYVIEGTGQAVFERKKVKLRTGALLLIVAGEEHEIQNTGKSKLKTLNFYSPPQY